MTHWPKLRSIESLKRKAVYFNAALAAGIQVPTGCRIRALGPFSSLTPLELDVMHGIQEDPSEQNVDLYLHVVDTDSLPDAAHLRLNSAWHVSQNWETVGSATGIFQTQSKEQVEFFNPITYTSPVDGGPKNRYLCIIANDIAGDTPGYKISAICTFLEKNIQREWPGSDDFDEDFYADTYGTE